MKTTILLVLSAVLSSGCVSFRYDPLVAESFRGLGYNTKEILAQGDAGRLSLADSRRFLKQSQAQLRVVREHADQCDLTADERTIVASLEGQYDVLLRRQRPLRSTAAVKLQHTLLALQNLRPVREFVVMRETFSSSTDDTSMFPDNNDTTKKDCDNHHDHSGHDHR